MERRRPLEFFLILLSGVIVALGQPSWVPWLGFFAAAVGYALFWVAVSGYSARVRFFLGALWFAAVSLIQLSWMTATEFQGVYILFIWLGFALCLGVEFGVLCLFVDRKMCLHKALAAASLWTLLEWSRLYILCGFTFNPAGLALCSYPVGMQMAALFGIFGLSFCVLLTNLFLFMKRYVFWSLCALFPYFFGWVHLWYHEDKQQEWNNNLSVALVQTGLLPSEKVPLSGYIDSFLSPYEQWRRIVHELKKEQKPWDLIALPEAALPFSFEDERYSLETTVSVLVKELGEEVLFSMPQVSKDRVSSRFWVETLARFFRADLVLGFDSRDQGQWAAAFHCSSRERTLRRYEKRVLVPLAEYIPFTWLKPLVASYGIVAFFTPGKEAKVFPGKVPFSLSICYEETFPDLVREGRKKGAEILVNLTNDNWYPDSRLAEQHYSLGRPRAIENGVPLIRACNSGITAAVDSLGRSIVLDPTAVGVLSAEVSLYHYLTLFQLWGEAGIVAISLIFIILFLRRNPQIVLL